MRLNSVGIIGYGNFGAFTHELLTRFAPHITVRAYSDNHAPDNKTFFSLEETAQCDAVVFAVPIRAYESALAAVVPKMREDAAIVDVATVKIHTIGLLQKLASGRPYIATHPMFGPESYTKRGGDVADFRIVVAEHTLPPDSYEELTGFLKHCGFNVIHMTAEEHDKHLAETLFLTHFVGQIVTEAKFDRTEIDTVSFGFLMDAVETVRGNAALFRDVFAYNPHCKAVLQKFRDAEQKVLDVLQKAD